MIYTALLRGINVGGNNKINMKELKSTFEKAGMEAVQTYINSGNIIFSHPDISQKKLSLQLETAIKLDFNLSIRVLIRDLNDMNYIKYFIS